MVRLTNANELTNFGATSARRQLEMVRIKSHPVRIVGTDLWQLTPSAFEYSMCVVAIVSVDGVIAEEGNLAAFVDGQLRGVAHPSTYKAPVGSYMGYKLYNLMVYGQADTEGATVTFQHRHMDGRVSMLTPTTPFVKDDFLGSVGNPYVVSYENAPQSTTATPSPSSFAVLPTDSITWTLPAVGKHDIGGMTSVAAAGALVLVLGGVWAWRVSTSPTSTKQGSLSTGQAETQSVATVGGNGEGILGV